MSARTTAREFESIKHAAERTDFSVFTIREKIDSGELPAYRLSDKPGLARRKRFVGASTYLSAQTG
jgi:hypothetical protein